MSYRNIELQVALPKVTEIGRVQQIMQQQHAHHQSTFEQAMQTKLERDLNRTNRTDENRSVSHERKESSDTHGENQQHKREQKRRDNLQTDPLHPFKGKHIDIRL